MIATVFRELFDRMPGLVGAAVDGLDEEQLAARIDPGANSIAWLVWHLTRVQDDHVAGVAAALDLEEFAGQVYPRGYADRFALPFPVRAHGYGQSAGDVAKVRASGPLLVDYHRAVTDRTFAFLDAMTDDLWDKVVDDRWDPPVTSLVRLASVVNDVTQHVGQAAFVRGVLERS